jgi:hypothetical protein
MWMELPKRAFAKGGTETSDEILNRATPLLGSSISAPRPAFFFSFS